MVNYGEFKHCICESQRNDLVFYMFLFQSTKQLKASLLHIRARLHLISYFYT